MEKLCRSYRNWALLQKAEYADWVQPMTKKQDPVEIDAVLLIMHSSQSVWSFEEYAKRVLRTARIKIR
jgi:major membrane immunogen (membrane-anchored lipoprotein)